MNDLEAVGSGLASLKTAFDLTKTLFDIPNSAKNQTHVIELQSKILAAQQSAMSALQTQSSLLDQIKALETEVARLRSWNCERDNYKLQDIGLGSLVYSPKAEPTEDQPNHWLCVKCFEEGRRSVIPNQGPRGDGNAHYLCPTCKNGFVTHFRNGPHRRGEAMSDGSVHP